MMKIVFFPLLFLLVLAPFLNNSEVMAAAPPSLEEVRETVAGLGLSFKGYTLCTKLTDEQVRYGATHRRGESYPGTYTLIDDTVSVVVEAESHSVIAIYQSFKEVGQQRVKEVVGSLMGAFGEPTNIAHDKMIYWLYGPEGSMSEDEFNRSKDKKEGVVDVIASVKLSSSRPIEQSDTPATLYWILSSNKLSKLFMEDSRPKP